MEKIYSPPKSPSKKTFKTNLKTEPNSPLKKTTPQLPFPSKIQGNASMEEIYYQHILQQQSEIDQLKEENEKLRKNEEIDKLKEQIIKMTEKENYLKKKMTGLKENENVFNNQLQDKNSQIDFLESRVLGQTDKILKLETKNQEREESIVSLQNQSNFNILHLETKIQELHESNTNLQKLNELKESGILERSDQISQILQKNQELQTSFASLQKKLTETVVEKLDKIQKNEELNKNLLQQKKINEMISSELVLSRNKTNQNELTLIEKTLKIDKLSLQLQNFEKTNNQNIIELNDLKESIRKQKESKKQNVMKNNLLKLTSSTEKIDLSQFNSIQSQTAEYLKLVNPDTIHKSEEKMAIISKEMMVKDINFSDKSNEFTLFLLNNYFRYLNVSMVLNDQMNPEIQTMLTHMLAISDFQKNVIQLELELNEYSKTYCNDVDCIDCKKNFSKAFKEEMSKVLSVSEETIQVNNYSTENNKLIVGFFLKNQNGLTDEQMKKLEENKANKNLKGILKNFIEIKIEQLFNMFQINANMLDASGNQDYTKWPKEKELRGNRDYFFPIGTRRIGLRVAKKYDNGSDIWLGMSNLAGEWVVAFHGTSKDDAVKNIVKDLTYKVGFRQLYKDSSDVKTGEKCGEGIYCALKYDMVKVDYSKEGFGVNTSNGVEKYRIAFQNRINPKTLKIPIDRTDYYIVNDPRDIRPYGILVEKL